MVCKCRQILKITKNIEYKLYNEDNDIVNTKKSFHIDKFSYLAVLGKGSFGSVLLANYTTENGTLESYALKILHKTNDNKQGAKTIEEINILFLLKHKYIIQIHGTFQTANLISIVLEPLLHGDLYMIMYENHNILNSDLILFYTYSLVVVLNYIHSKGIIYRDLKPENIMFNSNGYIKLVDVGLSKRCRYVNEYTDDNGNKIREIVDEKTYSLCGTPEYIAPEIMDKTGYNKSCDIWALGVVIYEMHLLKTPFQSNNMTELFSKIYSVTKIPFSLDRYEKTKIANPNMEDFITNLLIDIPSSRLVKNSNMLNHPIFEKLDTKRIDDGTYVPNYIPEKIDSNSYNSLSVLKPVPIYTGDNEIYKNI